MDVGGQGDGASPAPLTFHYHRSIAPTLGVLLGLAVCEGVVLHIVAMALWGWRIALPLGLVDLLLIVALATLLRSLRRHPVTIDPCAWAFRVGLLKKITIPLSQIRGLRESWSREDLRQRGVVNLALANWPNTVVEIDPPLIRGRRTITAVALKLDAPEGFAAALRALMDAR